MSINSSVLRVAIPSPLHSLFDYLPPEGCDLNCLSPGVRVRLPFGRSQTVGVLMEVASETDVPVNKLRAAIEVLDTQPVILADQMKLLQWAARYYHHPVGEVMAAALPVLLRQGEPATARHRSLWHITDEGREVDASALAKRAKRQAELLQRLQKAGEGLTAEQLSELPRNWVDAMAALVKKGWATVEQIPSLSIGSGEIKEGPVLNEQQLQAMELIKFHRNEFAAFMLDGVTGSGKTEIYLRTIEHVLKNGQQALVLIPEITLTPQLVERFKKRFEVPIAVLHSGLNDRERLNAWLYAASGDASIVIGTRSAIFTPLKHPGVIIIDEEHDASFKQQSGFRYSARDLAMVRAQQQKVPVILGSATPSFESMLNVNAGRYHHLSLPKRAGSAKPPKISLLDVRGQQMEDMISQPLLQRMRQHLDAGNQVMLFLNRRGFSPTLICHECGWVAECKRCDTHMTLHQKKRQMRCHHCGSQRPVAFQCPACGSSDLRPVGSGTERIEDALALHFPDQKATRIDRDSTRRKGSLEGKLDDIHAGESNILIGTQMLAKGHHFPNVTLVGILDGDQGLFGMDFRASERMAQLIVQVAGRAGREEKVGQVLIQTHHPDNPLLQLLCHKGYHAFAEAAINERELAALPPFTHMALLRAEANHSLPPENFLEEARNVGQHMAVDGVEFYGPMPAPMERRAGKYRAQLLLQAGQRQQLHKLLDQWVVKLNSLPESRKVRWSLDVDPVDLL